MIENVDVIAAVIVFVAALVSGNDSVALIETVDEGATPSENGRLALEMLYFQKLDVYERAIAFLVLSQRVLRRVPKGHADLADQLRRSAQSIPQNIAEGCGRTTRADKARHYTIARGSAMESASHLDVMRVEGLIEAEDYAHGIELLERIVAMLTRLIDP